MEQPFSTVLDLYEQGKVLSAWKAGTSRGELRSWPAIEPSILAGRLAFTLGAPRLGRWLHIRAFRSAPHHPEAQYYFIWDRLLRRGALAAWQERKALGKPQTDDAFMLADYHCQCARLLGALRDFLTAEEHMKLAFDLVPDRAWCHVERSQLFELEDRYEEALGAALIALELSANYRPAINATAHCLQLLSRDDEALDLLRHKSLEVESSLVPAQLIIMLLDKRLLDEADEQIERYKLLTPLREKKTDDWVACTQAAVASLRGDHEQAVKLVENVDHPYHRDIAENLKRVLAGDRQHPPRMAELRVDFVRQHESTCAPAILTSISRFWHQPAEHLALAEEICYDGTPAHSERKWADDNGWQTKEFRADWDSATTLIDRGVPFTLTIRGSTGGHLQAVTGYDEARGVLFIRDPTVQHTMECNAAKLFEDQRATGPRGMALVPVEQARLLGELRLPEQDLYDIYYAMELRLQAHDRDSALEHLQLMEEKDTNHRLTFTARRALAAYDQNPHEFLAATDGLLALYPDDPALQLSRLASLRELFSRDSRLTWLAERCNHEKPDPAIWTEYAAELGADARQAVSAGWYLRRALRARPDEPHAIYRLAELSWSQRKQEDAVELYRFASCIDDKSEFYSQKYFVACRALGRTNEALDHLRHRFDLLGAKSCQSAYSLFGALEELDRYDEAIVVLEEALEKRPDDGDLRLYAASKYGQFSDFSRAKIHLDAARGLVKHTAWLAEAARQARAQGNQGQALEYWRQIVDAEPLYQEAHATIALLLSEMYSREEALAHIRSTCKMFPHHSALRGLEYEWTEGNPAVEREPVLRALVDIDPTNAWVNREMALNLELQCRFDEALLTIRETTANDPHDPWGHNIEGRILLSLGDTRAAAECFRTAIRLSADTSPAIHGLLDAHGDTLAHRKEALGFVESELLTQVVFGDGLLAFRDVARGILTPDELLTSLRRAQQQRPDLWHAWSALSQHLADMRLEDEALEIAQEATARFSLVPRCWLDLSRVHETRQEWDAEIRALEKARELNPDWTNGTLALRNALERSGRVGECFHMLESAIQRVPLDPVLRWALADMKYRHDERDEAITLLIEALRTNPDYEWGWDILAQWTGQLGGAEKALDLARSFVDSRPGESRPWVRLAEMQTQAGYPEGALESLTRTFEIDDRSIDAYDAKAVALVALRRFGEAAEACAPPALGGRLPVRLRGRSAWVDAQRGDYSSAVRQLREVVEAVPVNKSETLVVSSLKSIYE